MHDALFVRQKEIPALASGSFASLAEELGLDVERFAADLVDPAVDAMIEEDLVLARKLGVRGTPASFVNGRFVSGAADVDRYASLADETRAAAQALLDAGTPATEVYDALMRDAAASKPASKPAR
jgi:protein-disulfide isomerase